MMMQTVFNEIESYGGKAYFVGGCVRDYIMNKPVKDIDIEVFGISINTLQEVLSKFGEPNLVGKSFGIIKITIGDQEYDFSIPRKDSKNGVGHKGFDVELCPNISLEEAAARRDFTINAISMDINLQFNDPYGGRNDISAKRLNPVSEAFKEDPLRILRGMQFSARFDMNPSIGCIMDCNEIIHEVKDLPKERIFEEFKKFALKGEFYSTALRFMVNCGITKLYPEIHNLIGLEQDKEFHPEGDVLIHTGFVLDEMHKICVRENITGDDRMVLIFSALCHDFGKAGTTEKRFSKKYNREVISSIGHEKASGPLARKFLESIGCPEKIIEKVVVLVENHMLHQAMSDKAIRKLSNRLGKATIRELVLLVEADQFGRPPKEKVLNPNVVNTINRAKELGVFNGKPEPIIKGEDILNLGYESGPIVGKILKKLYEMQLNGSFKDKESGLRSVKGLVCNL